MIVSYTDITLKLAFGLFTIILQINLFGKNNLAPVSALDQVQNYILGAIAGGMIYSPNITILQYILVLIIWTLLTFSLRFLTNHNRFIKQLIDGKPQIIIKDGKINTPVALKSGMSANNLSLKLRANDVTDLTDVKMAILEQNGQLTIMKQGDEAIKYPIITDGQVNVTALEVCGKDHDWLEATLAEQDYQLSDVYLATYVRHKLIVFPYEY